MNRLLWINPKKTNPNIVISDITILGKKWRELLKWRWTFDWIPFIDFALVAGSIAMGSAKEESDFDIILGCKKGRMFTARIFAIALFGLFGKRRKSTDPKEKSKNKFCFNHFVTPVSYTLRPPHNAYWQTLYQNLVPIYGKGEEVKKFFEANTWARDARRGSTSPIKLDNRWRKKRFNVFRSPTEFLFGGFLGTPIEYFFARYQLRRINKFRVVPREIPRQSAPSRLWATRDELELHPDISRIEEWINSHANF